MFLRKIYIAKTEIKPKKKNFRVEAWEGLANELAEWESSEGLELSRQVIDMLIENFPKQYLRSIKEQLDF